MVEQVWHIASMVKGKIPTVPREDNNIPLPITDTMVGFGLGPAMGGKAPAKHENTFEQRIFEVRSWQRTYSEAQNKEDILKSVKGVAVGIVRVMKLEPNASWRS